MVKIVEMPAEPPLNPNAAPNPQQQPPPPPPPPPAAAAPGAGTPFDQDSDDDTPSMARLRRWLEEGDGKLHKCLAWLSPRMGYSKWAVFWIGAGVTAVIMARTPVLAPFICNSISVATYSMKGTLTALAWRRWDEVGNWLVYWLLFQGFSVLDFLSKTQSLYFPVKTAIMAFFHLPPLFGARFVRRRWIDPLIYDGHTDMVITMKRAHPWLLNVVYDLDMAALEKMQEQQLRDHVQEKKLYLLRKFFGDRLGGSSNENKPTTPRGDDSTINDTPTLTDFSTTYQQQSTVAQPPKPFAALGGQGQGQGRTPPTAAPAPAPQGDPGEDAPSIIGPTEKQNQ